MTNSESLDMQFEFHIFFQMESKASYVKINFKLEQN